MPDYYKGENILKVKALSKLYDMEKSHRYSQAYINKLRKQVFNNKIPKILK